jgi:hypothetical protein
MPGKIALIRDLADEDAAIVSQMVERLATTSSMPTDRRTPPTGRSSVEPVTAAVERSETCAPAILSRRWMWRRWRRSGCAAADLCDLRPLRRSCCCSV